MKATLTSQPGYLDFLSMGDQLEVLTFVHHGGMLWAVCRDDEGVVFDVPAWAIRMEPRMAEVPA